MADPVRQWDPQIARAHKQYPDVPEWMMRALIFHESNGQLNAVNPTSAAFGLTQFLPSTARSYGVKPGDAQSQVTGMAHYLHALNVGKDPVNALDHHYGGPAAGGYYASLLQIAKSRGYHTAGDGTIAPAGASSAGAGGDASAAAGGGSDTSGLVKGIVRVGLVIGGAVTAGIGISRLTGLRAPGGTPGTAIAKTALAVAK